MTIKRNSLSALLSLGLLTATLPNAAFADGPRCQNGDTGQPSKAQHMLESLDQNADGAISSAEIEAATLLRAQEADTNGDGAISTDELQALRESARQERLNKRLLKADSNGDGIVSTSEFADHRAAHLAQLDRDGDGLIQEDELPSRDHRGPHRRFF